jgi:3-phenylpropionate/cinnamic acid dioxygenase small subunit
MDLQMLSDKLEIHELLARYARAVDTHDWDLYRSLFTDDAHIDYSSAGAAAGTRDEVTTFLEAAIPTLPWTQHVITNVEIDLDGDRAQVRATFLNPMQLPGVEGPSCCGGSYRHDLIRSPDGWRSRHLVEENRWFVNPFPGVET